MKEMELLQEEYSVSNVRIIFVAADRNQTAVRDIYDRLNCKLPCLLDLMKVYYYDYIPSLELSGKLVVPRTYIIGLDKTISYIHYGFDTSHKKDEIALIKAAIDSCFE